MWLSKIRQGQPVCPYFILLKVIPCYWEIPQKMIHQGWKFKQIPVSKGTNILAATLFSPRNGSESAEAIITAVQEEISKTP
jgi:hypothetical protein